MQTELTSQPYIQSGSKFFVARVDAKKAKFVDGQLVLSPLRFHYDADSFSLPVRLGLLNNDGTQDLIVHILAKDRYELANRENVFVPTNLDVSERAQAQFGGFYKELLARTFKQHPRAAVTEFAWQGALPPPQRYVGGGVYGVTCDPCPPARPVDDPLARYLGVDLLPRVKTDGEIAAFAGAATLTRLHLRYTKDSAPDDLVFKVAPPVHGGVPDVKGVTPAKTNRFQGRYLMWVDSCRASTLANSPGAQTNALELIDSFEQVITSEVRELGITPVPLPKNPKPLPPAPPPTPPVDDGITYVTAPPFELETPTVSGALDPELIKRVVSGNRGQLRYCFELQLAKNPQLSGRVEFSFDINPVGQVMRSALVSSTLADATATDCMLSRVRTWMFPRPRDNGMVTAKIAATFRAR